MTKRSKCTYDTHWERSNWINAHLEAISCFFYTRFDLLYLKRKKYKHVDAWLVAETGVFPAQPASFFSVNILPGLVCSVGDIAQLDTCSSSSILGFLVSFSALCAVAVLWDGLQRALDRDDGRSTGVYVHVVVTASGQTLEKLRKMFLFKPHVLSFNSSRQEQLAKI